MKDENLEGKKVIIAFSGGQSSAVTAYLLKKQGMKVIGAYFSLISSSYLPNEEKDNEEGLIKAKKLADNLGIAFYSEDFSNEFQEIVLSHHLACKIEGIKSNISYYKNNFIMQKLDLVREKLEASFISSGHFAKANLNFKTNEYSIHTCNDQESDESHLIGSLSKHLIENLLLPLGDLKKSDVEKIANNFKFKIEKAAFELNEISIKNIEKKMINEIVPDKFKRKGSFIHIESGNSYGDYESHLAYELSESNLKIPNGPTIDKSLEIVLFDSKKGNYYLGPKELLSLKDFQVSKIKWARGNYQNYPYDCYIKIQNQTKLIEARIYFKNNSSCFVELEEVIYPVIDGLVVTFYEKSSRSSRLIGQGMISRRGELSIVDRVKDYRGPEEESNDKANLAFNFHF